MLDHLNFNDEPSGGRTLVTCDNCGEEVVLPGNPTQVLKALVDFEEWEVRVDSEEYIHLCGKKCVTERFLKEKI